MKPLMFLDLDGVARRNEMPNNYILDTVLVKNINTIAEMLNASIVMTSNWRLSFSLAFFNSQFNNRVIGVTEDLHLQSTNGLSRLKEIRKFIEKMSDVTDFYILDDNPDYFQFPIKELFLCDPMRGFDDSSLQEFINKYEVENMSKSNDAVDGNEDKLVVTVSIDRKTLNKLTHITSTADYESAVIEAALEMALKYQSKTDPNGDHKYQMQYVSDSDSDSDHVDINSIVEN